MRLSMGARGWRHRRDRVAQKVVLTITLAFVLMATGGMWWLGGRYSMIGAGGYEALIVLRDAPRASSEAALSSQPVEKETVAPPTVPTPSVKPTGPMFNGRPLRKVKTLRMLVTGYSPDARSCGNSADNITASGYSVWTNGMKSVAADTRLLPFGSIVSVPGYDHGQPVPVLDRGGAIKGRRIDLLYPTHEVARQWGVKWVDITVWRYADE